MLHDERDPHFAVGFEHGYQDQTPYRWQRPEHNARYARGYMAGLAKREQDEHQRRRGSTAVTISQTDWQKFAGQMQSQQTGWIRRP